MYHRIAFITVLILCCFGGMAVRAEETAKPGILIVAHGGGPLWNKQLEQPVATFAEKHPELQVELAFLFTLGNAPTPQVAYDRLVERGATEVTVLPFFVSSHSFHYNEILFRFGKLDHLEAPEGLGHDHMPPRVQLTVPIRSVLPAIDDNRLAAQLIAQRVNDLRKQGESVNLILIGHGPNGDEDARIWEQNLKGLMGHIEEEVEVAINHCLLVRDDALEHVRSKAVRTIRNKIRSTAKQGTTLVVPVLVAEGELSRELKEIAGNAGGIWLDFSFAQAAGVEDYFYDHYRANSQ